VNGGVVGLPSSPAPTPIRFLSVENLRGGDHNDRFRFDENGRISGQVEGGSGSDFLDYSRRKTSVTVDLSAGTATSTAGIAGVENVLGGVGSDTIIGDDGANVLIGNRGDDVILARGGNDIVIGGAGADRLDGGSGEDILIGGATSHEDTVQAMLALMSEWQSAAPYATRVAHLRGDLPGGLNGTFFLTSTEPDQTVFDDEVSDVLTGGADLDWFFIGLGDTTDRFKLELAN
jgi:Ca2+-binding RTX toxin-like protein